MCSADNLESVATSIDIWKYDAAFSVTERGLQISFIISYVKAEVRDKGLVSALD